MKRMGLLAVVGFAAVVLAGCGDDEEALSKAEFLRRGNAICAEGNEKTDALFEKEFGDLGEGEAPDPEEFSAFIQDEVVPQIQSQLDDLGDLEPPETLADDFDQLLDDAQAALDGLEDQAQEDPEALLEQEEDPFAEVNEDAVELGLTVCGEEGEGEDAETAAAVAGIEPDPDHEYCALERKVDAIFEEAFTDRGPDDTDEAVAQQASQRIIDEGLIEQGEAVVPDVIKADFGVLVAAVRAAAQGDFSGFESAEAERAGVRVDYFCGLDEEN